MNFVRYLRGESAGSTSTCLLGHRTTALSHQALWRRVAALAENLRQRGRGRNYILLAPNGPLFVTAYLATMSSGNVIVPLEPRIARRELGQVVDACQPAAAFVAPPLEAKWGEVVDHVELLGVDELAESAADLGDVEVTTDEPAAIIFTSGSTGTRKGVMLSHGNLRANTESILAYLDLTHQDRMLVTLPFSYCYGASWLHTLLRVGGSLVLSNPISLGAVLKELNEYRCTAFAGVPSTYQLLANTTDFLDRSFPSLRFLAQAGGKLPTRDIERIATAFAGSQFFVMYGATEATARLSYLPPALLRERAGSIGKGIPGVTLEVRNGHGRPVAPGEIGEIVASGPSIMLGYYRDPEATAQVLREGWLHTGDLATVDDAGFIYIVGRTKDIIKSAGHRISPAQVEDVILEVRGVHEVRAFGVPDAALGEAVVAAVVCRGRSEDLRETIMARCRTELPSYSQPRALEFVDAMPLNASGKVDVEQLRVLFGNPS